MRFSQLSSAIVIGFKIEIGLAFNKSLHILSRLLVLYYLFKHFIIMIG